MKRVILSAALFCVSFSSFAWGGLGHATVAKIAEKYFTPATASLVKEFMNGESIVQTASMLDFCRDSLAREEGVNAGHTYCVDKDCKVYRTKQDENGNELRTGVPVLVQYCEKLKDYKNLTPRQRYVAVATIVHCIGDFHCPGHVRYYPDFDSGSQKVTFRGKVTKFHSVFDGGILGHVAPWSYSDLAGMVDIYSDAQRKEFIKGDIYIWGEETALSCIAVRAVPAGAIIDNQWEYDTAPLLYSQICKAGYRLAHVLNSILDPDYKE